MLNPGTKLGLYEILSPLGKGGMGEVYLANDTKLDRKVAIKVLPQAMTRDVERTARFEREAKLLASLNHPNIAAIYGFEAVSDTASSRAAGFSPRGNTEAEDVSRRPVSRDSSETDESTGLPSPRKLKPTARGEVSHVGSHRGFHFLVMEYVEGETLAQRLKGGAFAVEDALDIAKQMAEALEAAHEKGIIHRDLKPANVMIRVDGTVKVLDFGLAKAMGEESTSAADANSPTITANYTRPGVVLGTAAYMSPEQARGRPLDKRTDIWSFGAVLFECLTGTSPFSGETTTDVIAKIMEREPDYDALPDRTPRRVCDLLRRCLEKHSKRRLRDIGDALLELDQSLTTREWSTEAIEATQRTMPRTWPARFATIAVFLLLLLAAAYSGWFAAKKTTPIVPKKLSAKFSKLTDQISAEVSPDISPDGKSIVYNSNENGNFDIYTMRIGGSNSVNLTEKYTETDSMPVFSPDGQQIAFRSERQGGGLFVMGATGESPRRLTNFGFNPSWHPDGTRVFFATVAIVSPEARSALSALWSVVVATGETKKIYDGDAVEPSCSPGGHRIAYWTLIKGGQRDLFTIPATGGDPVAVTNDPATDWNPTWSPDGRYLYFGSDRGGNMNIWRVRIDERSGERLGDPEAITTGVTAGSAYVSIANDGKHLAYAAIEYRANIFKVIFDPETEKVLGGPVQVTHQSTILGQPDISPDGKKIVVMSRGVQEDLFIFNTDGHDRFRLTHDHYKDRGPRWSPDGKRIAFFSDRGDQYGIWSINSDGSGLQKLIDSAENLNLPVWSPDGTRIAFIRTEPLQPQIANLAQHEDNQTIQLLSPAEDGSTDFYASSWSPDGTKLLGSLYAKDDSYLGIGTYTLDTGSYELITDKGVGPRWLSDSRRFIFVSQGKLLLGDTESKKISELLSGSMFSFSFISIAPGDREIYFSMSTLESDIWLVELE